MKESLVRSLTGIALIVVVVTALILHPAGFLVLFSIILALSWLEFKKISGNMMPVSLGWPGALLLAGSFLLFYFYMSGRYGRTALLLPAFVPFLLVLLHFLSGSPENRHGIVHTLAGFLYLMVACAALAYLVLRDGNGYGPRWLLFTFAFLWMHDTMAYVSGRLFGKNRIWPDVSPSKTWEGSIGGTLFSLLMALVFGRYYPVLSTGQWAGFAIVVAAAGTAGDFLESWVKRKAGVKDSGSLLPGHGGILDRFDSLFLALPSVSLYLMLLK